MGIELDFNDFSNGYIDSTDPENQVWEGTGVFDELIKAINGNIQVQYDSGRIKGGEYATVYLGSMQAAISEAMKYMLSKKTIEKDIAFKEKQIESLVLDDMIKEEQHEKELALKYVQQVKLDKEAAALGLDDVVKMKETSRDGDYVYQVSYVQ